ncbi:MAG: GNAT family N-acetyltransferase [Chloroflexota bacterium]|nr:GNAT family N-acetyltransferase [Chloroflexota bacterium]
MPELPQQPLTPADLGFTPRGDGSWRKLLGGQTVHFRPLRHIAELLPLEALQRQIFGVSEHDLAAASLLVSVPETGGEVIGAFGAPDDAPLLGFVIGWGGYYQRRPRLVSDMLGVDPRHRNLGLGTELKRLQAAVTLAAGISEIVWTVDPLRASNAWLNHEKLGAIADRYEENRYGDTFGAGLYGGLPTDRLHVTWHLRDPRVHARLLGRTQPTATGLHSLPSYQPGLVQPRATVPLPADVDALLARDPAAVATWRERQRVLLPSAFAEGYVIYGAVRDRGRDEAAFLLERPRPFAPPADAP